MATANDAGFLSFLLLVFLLIVAIVAVIRFFRMADDIRRLREIAERIAPDLIQEHKAKVRERVLERTGTTKTTG